MGSKLAPTGRHAFTHEGRVIYEWDQTLEEVNCYVVVPPGVPAKALAVTVASTAVNIGVKGNPPYLSHDLAQAVKTDECFWTLEEEQQRLMLERFQEENPGFDFSGATFNGEAPDPSKFMGGVGYS